ncbi:MULTISPECIES: ATP-dependent nuclease [Priestia]|uniref:ATP-dependent nuclease n=1 Tax=Priestia TaxID=2800373 RepID=UPI002E20FB65|nr:AAA family ATPase [Priestia aryabhattai]
MNKNIRLDSLKITNFRCFNNKPVEVKFSEDTDISGIIGDNGTGKTTIIQALLKIFSNDPKERTFVKSDFNLESTKQKDKNNEGTQLEFDSTIVIEATLLFPNYKELDHAPYPEYIKEKLYFDKEQSLKMTIRLTGYWGKYANGEEDIDQKIEYIDPTGTMVDAYGETLGYSVLSDKNYKDLPAERHLIQFIYINSKRDIEKELVNRLLHTKKFSDEEKQNLINKSDEMNKDFQKTIENIIERLKSNWKYLNKSPLVEDINLSIIKLSFEEIINGLSVYFPENTTIEQISEGMHSFLYIALLQTILELENQQEEYLTIVAFEEPENYIAPSSRGKIINLLNKISTNNIQVILTTHSPSLVKRLDPTSMISIQVNASNSKYKINQIKLPNKNKEDIHKYLKGAVYAYPELYFAKLVILGEGASELVVLPRIIETLGNNDDDFGIVYVPLGGAHVNYMWKLLSDLSIPYITLLDLDLGRTNGGWIKINYIINQLLKNGDLTTKKLDHDFNYQKALQPRCSKHWKEMKKWDLKGENQVLDAWENYLKLNYNIIFSHPLDLDYMMLKQYFEEYNALSGNIQKSEKDAMLDLIKVEDAREHYKEEEKYLQVYGHLFKSNKGKPSVHLEALESIISSLKEKKEGISESIPEPINEIHQIVKQKLEIKES